MYSHTQTHGKYSSPFVAFAKTKLHEVKICSQSEKKKIRIIQEKKKKGKSKFAAFQMNAFQSEKSSKKSQFVLGN
jgi:hypothetical protein